MAETSRDPKSAALDRRHLRAAARLALRGHGRAEPNPLVGCVLVGSDGAVVARGWHRRFGGPHAEIEALHAAAGRARGTTAYVTLEPCAHRGKTGPCADALVEAGVARVVIARRDPHPEHAGGIERLRAAGIAVDVMEEPTAVAVGAPFAHGVETGRPWVIAKWAQTVDGRIATRTGASRWISGPRSRRLVHRTRGRVDAILTGIGTVVADDPLLNARDVRVRRVARRVVVDPSLRIARDAALVATADVNPTTIGCTDTASGESARLLRARGVEIVRCPTDDGGTIDLAFLLRHLRTRHDATNVLVEAGPGLLGRLFEAGLVNEAWVFVAPLLLGDAAAVPCVSGRTATDLADGIRLVPAGRFSRGVDVLLRYLVE